MLRKKKINFEELFVIVDEAHWLAGELAQKNIQKYLYSSKFRLGLTATPTIYFDEDGKKTNFIVKHGRHTGFFIVSFIFWIASLYFFILAMNRWYANEINFFIIAIISLVLGLYSSLVLFRNSMEKIQATKYAITTAFTICGISIFLLLYFIMLVI